MSAAASYIGLTKPRLLPAVLLSGLPALVLAAGGWPPVGVIAATLVGTALAAGAANALNSYLERDRDALMERTRSRPLPAGSLDPRRALGFGLVLSALGVGMLWLTVGATAALVALAAILFYVFVYTLWLKPRTPVAVILGGLSGAIAPLIADAAVDGNVGVAGALLFAIIFVWQPPHFYAITLYRQREYESAGFPMLVSRIGPDATRGRILAWLLALVPLTLLAPFLTLLGPIYGAAAAGLGIWFFARGLRLRRLATDEEARRFFRVSLLYLSGLFLAMIVDLAWAGVKA